MKKINLLIVGIVAMFGVMLSVQAQGVSLKCDDKEIRIGESTNCQIYLETDDVATETVITLSHSQYLGVTSPMPNNTSGWQADPANTNASAGKYAFVNTTGTKASQVFSFTLTVLESARNLSSYDECGEICISAITVNGAPVGGLLSGTGKCFPPVVVDEKCVGDNCEPKNPETGAFMNYVLILLVGAAAVAVILIVRRTSKFYRV